MPSVIPVAMNKVVYDKNMTMLGAFLKREKKSDLNQHNAKVKKRATMTPIQQQRVIFLCSASCVAFGILNVRAMHIHFDEFSFYKTHVYHFDRRRRGSHTFTMIVIVAMIVLIRSVRSSVIPMMNFPIKHEN